MYSFHLSSLVWELRSDLNFWSEVALDSMAWGVDWRSVRFWCKRVACSWRSARRGGAVCVWCVQREGV